MAAICAPHARVERLTRDRCARGSMVPSPGPASSAGLRRVAWWSSGMGKSGHIGGKIAATLASTGTPAFFLHPGEASHGDGHDHARRMSCWRCPIRARPPTGADPAADQAPGCALDRDDRQRRIDAGATCQCGTSTSACEESLPACLAPTASTTAALAVGDALAVALLEARGFTPEDCARIPAARSGRQLLLHVCDVMRTGDALPACRSTLARRRAVGNVAQGPGVDRHRSPTRPPLGVFTDGDLRRALDRLDMHRTTMVEVMTPAAADRPTRSPPRRRT